LNIIVSEALADPQPLVLRCRKRTCGERAFDGVGRTNVTPVLRREIKKCQQHISIFRQTRHRFFVLGFKRVFEEVERLVRFTFCWSPPNVVQHPFHLRLNTLGHLVEHVGRFVNRTSLNTCPRIHLLQSLPEAERSITDRQFRATCQASCFETQEDFLPRQFTLTMTIDNGDQFFRAVGRGLRFYQNSIVRFYNCEKC